MEIAELFIKGGPVMYLLLIISVAVAVIGIERLVFYNYADNNSKNFIESLNDNLRLKDITTVANLCHAEKSLAGEVALAGVVAATQAGNIELALEMAYSDAAMKLRSKLNYLSMIVTLSPLLGLLGTIFGMVEAFNIFNLQSGQPMAITGGIGEALIATATGLCVAIFALLVHTYFAQKLDEMLTKLEKVENIVLANLKKDVANETPRL